MIPKKFKTEYEAHLSGLFSVRVNLFCYIVLVVFLIELVVGTIFFRRFFSEKDIPGIVSGVIFSAVLLATGRINTSILFQKTRAGFFSALLILISILAAPAHPDVITHLGITLILIAFFLSVLLMPWGPIDAFAIGAFTFINFAWIYFATGTYINGEIFGMNAVLLLVSIFFGILVKRSEEVLRRKDFVSRKEIEIKNGIMMNELELARKIQRSIVPHSAATALADIAVTYKPMFYMGGDYAKFSFIDDDKLMFVVADVTGHGVSSALLVNRLHTEIERLAREKIMPGALLHALDIFINEDFGRMGFYLSAFCGLLDFSMQKLVYSNHGHPPQILIKSKDDAIIRMNSQTFLMGIGMSEENVYNTTIEFKRGDRLILFTDGITEARNAEGELFGHERLERYANKNAKVDVVEFNTQLLKEVELFQSGEQADDIFLVSVQTK